MSTQGIPAAFTRAMEQFAEDCLARGRSSRTVKGNEYDLKRFVHWCSGRGLSRPELVTDAHLEEYRRYLFKYRQPRTGKPLDIATQRNRLTSVKMFFRRLKRNRLIPADPGMEFEMPRVPKRLPRGFLTVEEVEALCRQTLLAGPRGIRDRAVIETYYATGVRRMELAHLDIPDYERKDRVLLIRMGKGKRERRVPIAKRACDWIDLYLEKIRPLLAKVESGTVLFLDNRGRKFREYQLTRIASKYVRRAGIKTPGACNLFRHSTGTLMHQNGADLLEIQAMLGHADITSTQVYTHVTIHKLKEVYAKTHPANYPIPPPGRKEVRP